MNRPAGVLWRGRGRTATLPVRQPHTRAHGVNRAGEMSAAPLAGVRTSNHPESRLGRAVPVLAKQSVAMRIGAVLGDTWRCKDISFPGVARQSDSWLDRAWQAKAWYNQSDFLTRQVARAHKAPLHQVAQ